MPIQIGTIPTTAKQDARLAKWLAQFNQQRQRMGQQPFATVEDAARAFIIRKLRDSVRAASDRDARKLAKIFPDLDDNIQDQIKQLAGY